jgi:hypothetical protein
MANNCTKCGKALNHGDIFCGNCGIRVGLEIKRSNQRGPSVSEYPHQESLIALQKIKDTYNISSEAAHKASRKKDIYWMLALVFIFYLLCQFKDVSLVFLGIVFFLFLIFILGRMLAFVVPHTTNKNTYKSLPFAIDSLGHHRCIFCGKPGIYTKGVYASASKMNYCSNSHCGKFLYSS